MASALPEHPIEMFKNNIALYHNRFGTCWNVMITYLLMYSDETRNKILDVVLLRELDYTNPILEYEYLIAMRAYELVECAFKRDTIDMVLPLSRSSPYFPYYKLKKKDVVTQIITQFMLRINRKCNDYTMRIVQELAAETPMDAPALRKANSVDDESCIQDYVFDFFDYKTGEGLIIDHSIIYFNLLSTIFINTLYYIQPIRINSIEKPNGFIEMLEQGDYNLSLGYMIGVHKHIVCIVKYKGGWKYCDNQYIYDFNMDEFMRDFNTPGITIVYNKYKGLIKRVSTDSGEIIVYYNRDLPEIMRRQPDRVEDTSNIATLTRVVEHDADKLPFRETLYKLLIHKPRIKTDIIYNVFSMNPLLNSIRDGMNDKVLELIMKGVNIDLFTTANISPIEFAFKVNNIEAARLLINYGCDLSNVSINNELVTARREQIKSGDLITPELQQLYTSNWLIYEGVQEPRKVIKQYYENLSKNAQTALYAYHQTLEAKYDLGIPIKSFISVYNFMIHINATSSVNKFRSALNGIIKTGGILYFKNVFKQPDYIQYVAEQSLISKKNKYIKYDDNNFKSLYQKYDISSERIDILGLKGSTFQTYVGSEAPNLDNIFYKKYIMYKHKYLKLKELAKLRLWRAA